ncbi:MAG TPA: acyl-CoA thioesterase [Caulobacteraceae bacterium]|jgi:acyl-CoA thioesterase YciA|nr:acyl-CoA thioesterase [Caulobacteraceae bacterium]
MSGSEHVQGAPSEAPVIRTIAMPSDTNPEGDIFGGWLMSQMDLAGATVAFRLACGRCATVAVDGMAFLSPVAVGDEVSLYARVTRTGRTSVQVAVEAWRRPRDGETVTKVTEGTFTYVAIDRDRKPRPVTAPA